MLKQRDIRGRLAQAGGKGRRGDHDLDRDLERDLEPQARRRKLAAEGKPLKRAAVLVPLVDRPKGMTVLLTQRATDLADHAGQISFPGGRIEPGDPDPEAAALREAQEEIGLKPAHVEIVGRLDLYVTRTGFEVTPVVGLVRPPFPLLPDPKEVAAIFEVPLSFILDPANVEKRQREFDGALRRFYVWPYLGYYIWGATAAMLVNLSEVLRR